MLRVYACPSLFGIIRMYPKRYPRRHFQTERPQLSLGVDEAGITITNIEQRIMRFTADDAVGLAADSGPEIFPLTCANRRSSAVRLRLRLHQDFVGDGKRLN